MQCRPCPVLSGLFVFVWLMLLGASAPAQQAPELSLEEAIALAVERSPRIHLARQAVAEAEGRALQSRTIARPELSVTWTGIPSGLSFGRAEERELGLSQALEFPGKRRLRGRIGDLGIVISRTRLERTVRLVTARVKQSYDTALASQTVIRHLESVRDLLSGFVDSALSQYRGGKIPFVEVLRFKVELARLDNDLIEARRRLAVRLRELNLTMGLPPDRPFILTDRLTFAPFVKSLEEVQARALEDSRLLRATELTLSQADRTLRLAEMGYYPDFSVGGFWFHTPGVGNDGWTAEMGLEIPLWGWWEQRGRIEEASALRARRLIQQEALKRAIRSSVLSAFERVKAAQAQVELFQTSLLDDTADALQSAVTEYQFNRIDSLNLLDLYRTYKATQVEYTRALLNYRVALADLEVAAEMPVFDGDSEMSGRMAREE